MKIVINGKPYDSPVSFTLGEARVIQKESGFSLASIEEVIASGNADAIAALIFILMRREDPAVTMADVDALDIATITFDEEENGDENGDAEAGQSPPADGAPSLHDGAPKHEELESAMTRESSGAP